MAGVTGDEGSSLAFTSYTKFFNKTVTEEVFKQFIEEINPYFHDLNAEKITDFYLKSVDKNNSDAIKQKIYDFYGDILIKCPTYLFTKGYAERSLNETNVYFYEFNYTSIDDKTGQQFGVYHGSELKFVFGLPLLEPKNSTSEEVIEFTKDMIRWWTDFAKYG